MQNFVIPLLLVSSVANDEKSDVILTPVALHVTYFFLLKLSALTLQSLGSETWRSCAFIWLRSHPPGWGLVLAPQGCHNQILHGGWLKATEVAPLPVPEVRSLKLKCQQAWFLLEILRENLFHASLLAASGFCKSLLFLGL